MVLNDIYYLSNIFLRLSCSWSRPSSYWRDALVPCRLYYIALIGNLKAFTVLVMGLRAARGQGTMSAHAVSAGRGALPGRR